MNNFITRTIAAIPDPKIFFISLVLIVVNLIFNILSNVGFKFSILGHGWRHVLGWQVVGNLAGLVTVITLTLLLKYMPLHVAFPLTTGLSVIGISVIASGLIFHEDVTPSHWLGTILITLGIVFLSRK